MPPSRHVSGSLYRWAPGCAPDEVEIAQFPGGLVPVAAPKTLSRSIPKGKRPSILQLAKLCHFAITAPVGERNKRLFWTSCRLAELVAAGAIDQEDAEALALDTAARTGFDDSFTEASALKTIRSGLRRASS